MDGLDRPPAGAWGLVVVVRWRHFHWTAVAVPAVLVLALMAPYLALQGRSGGGDVRAALAELLSLAACDRTETAAKPRPIASTAKPATHSLRC